MKNSFILILVVITLACASSKNNMYTLGKLEIIKIDSIQDHFVFRTKDGSGNQVTVLAEKDKVSACKPFKRYIITDSIYQVSAIKSGDHYDLIGFNVYNDRQH